MVTMNCTMQFTPFLRTGLTRQKNDFEIKAEADQLELPFYLILNGVPERMVALATEDQLALLRELVVRKKTSDKTYSDMFSMQMAIGRAFGGKD